MANRFTNAVRVLFGIDEVPDITTQVMGTRTERRIADHSATASIDYMACELAKMRPVAALPVHVYEREGSERIRSNHRVARDLDHLLTTRWNPMTSAQAGIRWVIFTRDTLGTAYVRAEWRAGRLVALWPVESRVRIERTDTGRIVWHVLDDDRFTDRGIYERHEILSFTSPVPKCYGGEGRSLADVAMAAVGLSIDLQTFYSNLLHDGNHFPGWLETSETLSTADKNELRDTLAAGGGIVASGQARLFPKGVTYHQVPLTMAEMDLTKQQTWILERICAVMGVPPTEVGDLSHGTYSNTTQQSVQFAQKTLVPEVKELEAGFQPVLDAAGLEQTYVRFNLEGLLRGTYAERMEGYRTGVYAGFFVRNEVRSWEDLPALPGLDAPLQPTAYVGIDPESGLPLPQYAEETPAGALAPVYADMVARVRDRFASTGDCARSRDFATRVLKPYADACTLARIDYDLAAEVERLATTTPVEGIIEDD